MPEGDRNSLREFRYLITSSTCTCCNTYSRVILKRHGEFIYTPPPLPMLRGGEETTPPGLGVSAASVEPPPSLSSAPHDEATAEREHYSVSVCADQSERRRSTAVLRRVTRANLQPFRKFNPQVSRSMLP